jgi:hypothetical protein
MSRSLVWQYFDVGCDETENREKPLKTAKKYGFGFQTKTTVSVFLGSRNSTNHILYIGQYN